jgi:hypothetical protein
MTFWPAFIIGVIVTFLICFGLHTWDVDRIIAKDALALKAQAAFDIMQYHDQKQITSNSDKTYENLLADRDALARQLRDKTPSIVYVTKPASGSHAAAQHAKLPGADGCGAQPVAAAKLYDIGNDCETERDKVITLQKFINDTWKANGQ